MSYRTVYSDRDSTLRVFILYAHYNTFAALLQRKICSRYCLVSASQLIEVAFTPGSGVSTTSLRIWSPDRKR